MNAPLAPTTPPPKKKTRWFRWVLLTFLVLLLVALWVAPGVLAKSSFKDKLIADLTADVSGTVRVGEVSLNWLHPVTAFDLRVTDDAGKPVLSAKKVSTSKTLLDFVLNRRDLGTLRIEQPAAEIAFENGTTNVQRVFAKYLEPGDGKTSPRPAVAIELTDGTVKLADVARKQTTELTAISGTAAMPGGTDPITFRVSATAGGPVTAEGQIGGENKATLDANEFDLSALAPALRHFAPDVAAGGKLRGKFAASWSPAEQGLPAFTADGELHISQMVLSAPALGDRPVQLASAAMPLSATFDGKVLKVARWNVTCDVGTLGFAGEYDTTATPETLLNQTGLSFDADIDLAKLGRVAPGLLRLKPGTELTRGRVTATMASRKAAQGVTWSGSVLASKVEGVQGGRAVSWDQPLSVTFAGRVRADGLPVFDDLVVQSDFIGARAAGEPENFDAIANVNLDVLSRHLEELLDLNGLKLQGEGKNLLVKVRSKSGGGYTLTADGTVRNLVVRDNSGVLVSDPSLVLSATAEGDIKGGTIRIDTGRAGVTAGTDVFTVTLLEPIADAKALRSGKAAVAFSGDLDRWRGRVGRLAGWPKDWAIAGTVAEANATVSLGDALTVEKAKVVVHNAQFRGCGLAVDEQFLQVNTAEPNGRITLDPKTGAVGLALCEMRSETVSGAVAKFDLTPNPNGGYGMAGKANVVARLDRIQKTLQLQTATDLSDQFRGLARGPVEVSAPTFDAVSAIVDLAVEKFEFGPPTKPTWAEPWVKVKGGVGYQFGTDTLTLKDAVVERDGLTVSGSGTVAKVSTEMVLDVSGTLGYDLAKVEPVLKEYLGKTAAASGKDTRPFTARGGLRGGPSAAVQVGDKPVSATDFTGMSGTAGLGWTSLRAYGFDVGKGDLTATADRGRVTTTPIRATFGGGTVTAEPTLRLMPGAYDLSFKQGRMVERAKLTPGVCAEAIGYALPALANAAQADGTVSFDLGENGFPLSNPSGGSFKGTLTVHEGAVSPGPIITQVLDALQIKSPSVQLQKETAVPVELKNGRVHHSNFTFLVGSTPVSTSGSVGTDGTLDLTVTVPVGGTVAERWLPNNPALQKVVARQQVAVKVKGTLGRPQLDSAGMARQLQGVVASVAKDAIQDRVEEKKNEVVDDLKKKAEEAARKKLEDLFKPKK